MNTSVPLIPMVAQDTQHLSRDVEHHVAHKSSSAKGLLGGLENAIPVPPMHVGNSLLFSLLLKFLNFFYKFQVNLTAAM